MIFIQLQYHGWTKSTSHTLSKIVMTKINQGTHCSHTFHCSWNIFNSFIPQIIWKIIQVLKWFIADTTMCHILQFCKLRATIAILFLKVVLISHSTLLSLCFMPIIRHIFPINKLKTFEDVLFKCCKTSTHPMEKLPHWLDRAPCRKHKLENLNLGHI